MHQSDVRRGLTLIALAGLAASAQAQQINWAAVASDNWSNPSAWAPANVPDSAAESAVFGFDAPYTVFVNGAYSIDQMHLLNGQATVQIDAGQSLTLNGDAVTNNGIIQLNPQGSASDSILHVMQPITLDGTGEIWLRTLAENARISGEQGAVITQGADHTVRGVGQISSGLLNLGQVRADVSVSVNGNTLELSGADKTNQGTIDAAASTTLILNGFTLDQSGEGAPGLLRADDAGTVTLGDGLAIIGGEVTTDGSGVVSTSGSITLADVASTGRFWHNAAHVTTILGNLHNTGIFELNRQGSGSDSVMSFSGAHAITGDGEIWLRTLAENARLDGPAESHLIHGADHTIRGAGRLTVPMTNYGTIIADISASVNGNVLELTQDTIDNLGLIAVGPGMYLDVDTTIDQTGDVDGMIQIMDGGQLRAFNGTVVRRGSIMSDGSGIFSSYGNVTLDTVMLNGNTWLNAAHTFTIHGDLVNNGIMELNRQGSGSDSVLYFPETQFIEGTGEIWLRTLAENARIDAPEEATVVLSPGHVIRGVGAINAAMLNQGEIRADHAISVNGNELDLSTYDKMNDGVIRAVGPVLLDVNGITIDQTGGGAVEIEDQATLRFMDGSAIVGGEVNVAGGGLFNTQGATTTLDGVDMSGLTYLNAGNVLLVRNGLHLDGTMELNRQGSGADAVLRFEGSQALTGNADIWLRTLNENARIETSDGAVLTISPDVVVQGVGRLSATVVNEGEVRADVGISVNGNVFQIQGGDKTNSGLISVKPATLLEMTSCVIDQAGGGTITADDATVQVGNGLLLRSGAIQGVNNAVVSTIGNPTFESVTFDVPSVINTGHLVTVTGSGLTNNDLMRLNPQYNGADSILYCPADATLDGTGEVELFTIAENSRISGDADVTVTQGPDHTITGIGQVTTNLINHGTLSPGVGGVGTLSCLDDFEQSASGRLVIDFQGNNNGDSLAVTGHAALGGTVEVALPDGFEPSPCDIITVLSASSIEGTFDQLIQPPGNQSLRYRLVYTPTAVELRATCLADLNADCSLDILDFVVFQQRFQAGDPEADCDGNGILNVLDFVCFQSEFLGPCQ